MSRRIEQRTDYGNGFTDEWGPADEETQRAARRFCYSEDDYRRFVRNWNSAAKARGDGTRIRSVENDES
jgi:hypothetical protein